MVILSLSVSLACSFYWLAKAIYENRLRKKIAKRNEFVKKSIYEIYLKQYRNKQMSDIEFREILTNIFVGNDYTGTNNEVLEKIIESWLE